MTPIAPYISKDRVLSPSEDFHFLQKEGMKFIEKFGNKLWTDYNPHDPGITILEVLCYAITELGYRTNFDIKDLLTEKSGKITNQTFFTAANIFTNAALTETDFRKLLIDIDGVSNAWMLSTKRETDDFGYFLPHENERKIYVNKLEDKLSLKETDKKNHSLKYLNIRGLNKIKIELEEDPELGDLNSDTLDFAFWFKNKWIKMNFVPLEINWINQKGNPYTKFNTTEKFKINEVKKTEDFIKVTLSQAKNTTHLLKYNVFLEDISEIDDAVKCLDLEKNICAINILFEKKVDRTAEIINNIKTQLHDNRNLTEDYLCTEIIEKVSIGICADVELNPGADVVETMSEILIAIDTVINPKIKFYSLKQLLEEGFHSEDIFLGPKLSHGFLKDEEIENAQLPTEIHASDLIAKIMEIEGVKSIKNMLLSAYDSTGKPIPNQLSKSWILELNGELKPVFDAKRSKLLLFQKNIPFLLSETQQMEVSQKVELLKSKLSNPKISSSTIDIEIENGNYFQLENYYSIQDDFPVNYKVGKNILSDKATNLRKAQSKQLKGYLHFFEQLLANYFSQLYNAKNIFDSKDIDRTYFQNFIEKNAANGSDYYSKELYNADFGNNLIHGETKEDVSLAESKDAFFDRRNRVLDHLMARFSESFSDYVFMMYKISHDSSGLGQLYFDNQELITDKQNFLKNYPEISAERGLGVNYFKSIWNEDYRAGYEKRVAKLLGMNEIILRNIVSEDHIQKQWTVETKAGHFTFLIYRPNHSLAEKWEWAQMHFLDGINYKITTHGIHFHIYLFDEKSKIARLDKIFSSASEAAKFLEFMIKTMNIYYENFYCVEHILLRPFEGKQFDDEDLLSVCLNDECDDEANNDPYSFKATLVLPGYLSRFRNITFRKYAEKIFRQEAPTHVLLKICWVGKDDLLNFQKKYRKWIKAHAEYRLQRCNVMDLKNLPPNTILKYEIVLKEFVEVLEELNTIYPEGNLYDCHISETKKPMILNNSSLGTL